MRPRPSKSSPIEQKRRYGVAGVVVIGGKFLVIKRSQSVAAPGAFCFPGGAIEPGESESAALKREMMEELAVSARPVRRLWQSVTHRRVHLAWWLTQLEAPRTLLPNPSEVESVHWKTAKEMLELPELLESNRQFLRFLGASGFSVA